MPGACLHGGAGCSSGEVLARAALGHMFQRDAALTWAKALATHREEHIDTYAVAVYLLATLRKGVQM